MKPKDLFRYGCTNLFRRKTRTALTALSMAVGVMCIVVLISVGLGYEQAYRESIEALGSLTKIDVTPATGDYGRKALLNDKALEAFRGIDGVEAVTPVYQQSAYIVSGNYVNMVRVYGIDMTTAENFMLTPERGVMAGDGTHLHPEVMFTDDVAAGLANKAKDWELAVDENGNALIDLLEVPVRMTFDSSSLTGEPKADTDGRALPSSNLYTLRVTGICSTLNNNFATAAFMSFDRLQEMTKANANYMGATTQTKTAEEKANGPNTMWVLQLSDLRTGQELTASQKLDVVLKLKVYLQEHHKIVIVDSYGTYIVALTDGMLLEENTREMGEDFVSLLEKEGYAARGCVFDDLENTSQARDAYNRMIRCFAELCAVYPRRKIYSDSDVRYVQSCIDSVKQGEDAVADCLLPIRKLKDTADGDILIETLCTYLLDAESNTQSTGTLLYLHKNTVHYRLNKIRSVLKCDLVQMPATLAVYKAAVVYRILKGI